MLHYASEVPEVPILKEPQLPIELNLPKLNRIESNEGGRAGGKLKNKVQKRILLSLRGLNGLLKTSS